LVVESSVSLATNTADKEQPYIYPNPTQENSINIFIPANSKGIHVSVYDKIGKELLSNTYYEQSKGAVPFDISSLSQGSYTISVRMNGTVVRMPLVIL
jgi:hypothetical protein